VAVTTASIAAARAELERSDFVPELTIEQAYHVAVLLGLKPGGPRRAA